MVCGPCRGRLGVLTLIVAVGFTIEEHNYRVLMEDLDRTGVELKILGEQITDIKDANLQSMNDYISAYAQVAHLQSDYDQKLQKYSELYALARKRDSDPSFFNVERFRGKHHPETWERMTEIIDLVHQINELTKTGNRSDPCDGRAPGARAHEVLARAVRAAGC
jgi:hypothetical protein